MTQIRVLHALNFDVLAGAEASLRSLLPRIDRRRFQVQVAFRGSPGPVGQALRQQAIEVHYLRGRGLADLLRLARANQFDLVHLYGFRTAALARLLLACSYRRAARVVAVRGLDIIDVAAGSPWNRIARLAEIPLSFLADLYICNSSGAVDRLRRLGITSARLRYVPSGIDLEEWPPARRHQRIVPVINCTARFSPLKRHQDLLHALALLRDRGVAVRARLIGGGPTLESMKGLADELALPNVTFTDVLPPEQVAAELYDADIFCLVSSSEGMSRSVMEAMAAALPVVGTNVNGIRDLVVDRETGYLVRVGDPGAIADAIERLASDATQRHDLGAAGRLRIESAFSIQQAVEGVQDAYANVMRLRPVSRRMRRRRRELEHS